MRSSMISIVIFILASCTTTPRNFPPFNAFDLSKLTNPQSRSEMVVALFANQCMSGELTGPELEETATQTDWQIADEQVLKTTGLAELSKKVLEIPGGGSKVRETQSLFYKTVESEPFVLVIEERFFSGKQLFTGCKLHAGETPVLETCAKLGEVIGRAPDFNRHYKSNDSRFITWNGTINRRETKISCQRSVASVQSSYDGLTLSAILGSPASTSEVSKPVSSDQLRRD